MPTSTDRQDTSTRARDTDTRVEQTGHQDAGLASDGLTAGYIHGHRRIPIVSDVTFAIPPAHFTVMVGRNGSGKSTLLRTLAGIQAPLDGRVTIHGCEVRGIGSRRLARLIAMVFPTAVGTGAGALTVYEATALGRHPHTGITGHLSDVDRHVIREAIEAVGLSHKADTPLAALSDGLRQKAMIARALAQQTPVIIMDEPTAFLDVPSRHALMDLVAEMAHRHGRTVLLSTHDMAPALEAGADSVIVVEAGHASMHSADNANEALAALYADDGITYDPDAYDFRPFK
ncbi:MAG TPA: ABC transporter ATP-binding protein [Muribaculaceae bacterium]|nr:ABC transporter ATP-binding protein [Muribaculaceae bacterium]